MNIVESSAKITASHLGAVPAVHDDGQRITFHLSRGYAADKDIETISDAINFIGTVQLSTTPAEMKAWEFNFTQYQEIHFLGAFYAGPKMAAGQISLLFDKAPAMATTVHLDSEDEYTPWTHAMKPTFAAGKLTAISGDHPASRMPRQLVNHLTQQNNHLFHVVDSRTLWTVLTARDDRGDFRHLAHVTWTLRYDVMFTWKNGTPQVHKNASSLSVGASQPGAPAATGPLKALLASPKGPHSNTAVRQGIANTFLWGRPNRTDDSQRAFRNLPPNFWS